ncbi:hypothetical protein AB7942_29835 [Neobacillus sp. BF23-41]|uniref:hypothetical protein n=1 Tax=Neobacillus sp. BF23-41 TaxID=3240280 RepID=UPI0034E41CCE
MKNRKVIDNEERPPYTVTLLNEPNFEHMAKAFQNLYNMSQKERESEKNDSKTKC